MTDLYTDPKEFEGGDLKAYPGVGIGTDVSVMSPMQPLSPTTSAEEQRIPSDTSNPLNRELANVKSPTRLSNCCANASSNATEKKESTITRTVATLPMIITKLFPNQIMDSCSHQKRR